VDAYLVPAADGLAYGLLLFVVAAGLALAFGVGETLNLAHGTLYAVGAYAAAALGDGGWLRSVLALGAGTVAAAALGGVVAVAVHPVARRGFLTQALLTFGLALVGGDLLAARFGSQDLPVRAPLGDSSLTLLGHRYPAYRLAFLAVGVLLLAGLHLAVTRTRAGMLVRALASQAAVAIRNARLEDLSFKDALTDVYNRRYFMVRIEEEWKRHSRFAEPVSLVLLDLDNFKHVNDRFGHRAGDEALREVARLLIKHSRNFTIVTRFGGDEFAVLLVNTPKLGGVCYARRIREVIDPENPRWRRVPLFLHVRAVKP